MLSLSLSLSLSSSSSSSSLMIDILAVLFFVLLIDGFSIIIPDKCYNNHVRGVSFLSSSIQQVNNNNNNKIFNRRNTHNRRHSFFPKNRGGQQQQLYSGSKLDDDDTTILDEITSSKQQQKKETSLSSDDVFDDYDTIFNNFVSFIIEQQTNIINKIESSIELQSKIKFSKDCWGIFDNNSDDSTSTTNNTNKIGSGGITRVIQGGNVIEKGACSITVLRNGTLTAERAIAIQSRQQNSVEDSMNDNTKVKIQAGDIYYAAALSIVFHTKSPHIPTFRSDVRIFIIQSSSDNNTNTKQVYSAWFGGGADLTPYYVNKESFIKFHMYYNKLCNNYPVQDYSYQQMKVQCDNYFYIPCRAEHRGIGGIFFDTMNVTLHSYNFIKNLVQNTWLSSWLSSCIYITTQQNNTTGSSTITTDISKQQYTQQEKNWQCLRRGRYLEFNLLYDRGVKFGLMTNNPRVEGVMVSAPPEIQYYYNYPIVPNSREDEMIQLLKNPIDWI